MKIIFLVQDYLVNKRIKYYRILSRCKNITLKLIAYNVNQEELDKYILENSLKKVFSHVYALNNLHIKSVRKIIASNMARHTRNVFIVTNSEMAVGICGQLRKEFGLDGDDLLRYSDKIKMKASLKNRFILPNYMKFSREKYRRNPKKYLKQIESMMGDSVFVKPTNQHCSIGTALLNSVKDFDKWYKNSQNNFQFEIDEVITGTLYHCDTLVKNNKIIFTQVCKYLCPCYDFIMGKPLGSIMLPHNSLEFKFLSDYNSRVLNCMIPPRDGLTHLEVFKKINGELVFLEIAARPPGAQVPALYEKTLNIFIREAHILLQIDPSYRPHIKVKSYGAWMSYPIKSGVVKSINKPNIKSLFIQNWNIKIGEQLNQPHQITETACSIIFWNNDYEQLKKDFKYLEKFNAFEVV